MKKPLFLSLFLCLLCINTFAQTKPVSVNRQPVNNGQNNNYVQGTQSPGLDVLGYGYDVFGNFADQTSKKPYCLFVFDNYKTVPIGSNSYKVPDMVILENISKHLTKTVSGSSIRDYAKSLSASVGLSGETKFFKGSINSSYNSTENGTEQKFYFTYMDANTKWRIGLDQRVLGNLKNILDPQFKADLENMDPKTLFELYGTHYIANAYLGGRADYNSVSTLSENSKTSDITLAVTAEFQAKLSGNKLSTDINFEKKNAETLKNSNTTTKLTVTGGYSQYANNIEDPITYKLWADGIETMPVLCDFDKTSLRPIWEFASTTRAEVLKTAFNNLCAENPLPAAFANLKAIADKAYMIKNLGNGMYFDFVQNPNTAKAGDILGLFPKDNNSNKGQGFDRIYRIQPDEMQPEYVYIRPQHTSNTLDVKGGVMQPGTQIHIWPFGNQNKAQMFKLEPVDGENDTYYIRTTSGLCIEFNQASNQVALAEYNGSNNQKWFFETFDPANIIQPADGFYAIQSCAADKYWDFPGTYPEVDSDNLQLYAPGNAIGDRTFKVAKRGEYFVIRPNHHPTKLLTTSPNSQIVDNAQTFADNQLFYCTYGGQPNAYIIACKLKKDNNTQVIDANADRTQQNGCPIFTWNYHGGANQRWILHGPWQGQKPIHEGTYFVKCEGSNKYWDLAGQESETYKNGVRAQIWDLDGGADRKVSFEPCDDDLGYYYIKFGNGKYLDVSGAWHITDMSLVDQAKYRSGQSDIKLKSDKGAKLQCYSKVNNDAQKFKVIHLGNNVFRFESKVKGNRNIDVTGGNINKAGSDLQLWDRNNNAPAQRFVLISTDNNQPFQY